jgi:hypothetical protein
MRKTLFSFLLIALMVSLAACGGASKEDQIAVVVALTQTAAASSAAQPATPAVPAAELGHIVGTAHGMAPPTPAMTIYAIEVSTNEWASVQTAESQGEVSFTFDVKPGVYVVFSSLGLGYPSEDGWSLGLVNVASGQTVSGITVAPPSQSDCGAMFGVPASPDGLYPAIPGPTEECMITVMAGGQVPISASSKPQQIQFAPGATSASLQGHMTPGSLAPYSLGAMAGQEMGINLTPGEMGILSIWGLDGTVLMAESERGSGWRGIVPTTQEYYIDVISVSNNEFDYTLDVYVSALTQGNPATNVFPKVHPFNAAYMQGIFDSGLPAMLPPSFPSGGGLPEVVPYFIFTDSNSYAYSLDYGADCQGGGACHYGSFTAAANSTGAIISINGFPFNAGTAQKVPLDRGITGYFMDSTCGASCSDAAVWWMYNGYQYSLGMKASRDQIIATANAAINNSIP